MSKSSYGNPGDDFPRNARFGVMCVSGYPDGAGDYHQSIRNATKHSFHFYVVDTVECGQTVAKYVGQGDTLKVSRVQEARRRAQQHASMLNRRDRAHDKIHATL